MSELTLISSRVAPEGDHGEEPMEESALNVPVPSLVDQLEREEDVHPDHIGRDAVEIVEGHEEDPKDNHTSRNQSFHHHEAPTGKKRA